MQEQEICVGERDLKGKEVKHNEIYMNGNRKFVRERSKRHRTKTQSDLFEREQEFGVRNRKKSA